MLALPGLCRIAGGLESPSLYPGVPSHALCHARLPGFFKSEHALPLVERQKTRSNDRMALANSAALWTGVLVALARDARDHAAVLPTATIAADIAFAIGYAAWPSWPVSRGQAGAIDLGAGIGLSAGAFIGLFIPDGTWGMGKHTSDVGAAVGAGVGVAAALAILRNKPFPQLPVHVVPRADGLALAGVW